LTKLAARSHGPNPVTIIAPVLHRGVLKDQIRCLADFCRLVVRPCPLHVEFGSRQGIGNRQPIERHPAVLERLNDAEFWRAWGLSRRDLELKCARSIARFRTAIERVRERIWKCGVATAGCKWDRPTGAVQSPEEGRR